MNRSDSDVITKIFGDNVAGLCIDTLVKWSDGRASVLVEMYPSGASGGRIGIELSDHGDEEPLECNTLALPNGWQAEISVSGNAIEVRYHNVGGHERHTFRAEIVGECGSVQNPQDHVELTLDDRFTIGWVVPDKAALAA